MKAILSAFIGMLCFISTNAQRQCGTHEHHEMLMLAEPSYGINRSTIENFTRETLSIQKSSRSKSSIVTIPVVVHVLYNNLDHNITDEQINSQIEVLNKDFRRLNEDANQTPELFSNLAADAQIEFALATTGPDGKATNGIIRKFTNTISFSDNDYMKFSSKGGDDAWPAGDYLNIWICNLTNNILGYAQLPGGKLATDGVVIQHSAFGTNGTAKSPYNKGRTTVHEIGHWLNLNHIWGDDKGSCEGSDYVEDTPNQAKEHYGKPVFPQMSCSNTSDMFMNYMDYTDDVAMNMFSKGQAERMQALFEEGGARYSITNSHGLNQSDVCADIKNMSTTALSYSSVEVVWSVTGDKEYTVQLKETETGAVKSQVSTTGRVIFEKLYAGRKYGVYIKPSCGGAIDNTKTPVKTVETLLDGNCVAEAGSNNTRLTAEAIMLEQELKTSLDKNDIDWYEFENTADKRNVRIEMNNLTTDFDIALFDEKGTLITRSRKSGNSNELIRFNEAPVGKYYIKVYGYKGAYDSRQCYSLNVSTSDKAYKTEQETGEDKPEEIAELESRVYPNPSSGNVTLDFHLTEEGLPLDVAIYDLMGRKVKEFEYINAAGYYSMNLEIQDLRAGVYNLLAHHGDGKFNQRLVISR
jgi:hypothetical protein